MAPSPLVARGLGVHRFGRWALDGVDLEVGAGEVVGLIGPPEAGKTTLLKALAGLQPFDRGSLGAAPQSVGFSFQNNALFDAWSVFDNVAFVLRYRRVSEPEVRARVLERLRDVDLLAAQHLLPRALSGGMQKRLGVARATIAAPRVGLFDDPIAGLDPQTCGRILRLLVALSAQLQMACVLVSNDLRSLLPFCPRVVMLYGGKVAFDGPTAELVHSRRPEVLQFVQGSEQGPL